VSKLLFKNNASGTLSAEMTAIATSFALGVGEGNAFPNPTSGQSFMVTLQNGANIEIMEVTARSGDTFTVVRAQEGTTAQIWAIGTPVEMRLTAGVMDRFFQLLAATVDFAATLALGTTGKITGGTLEGNTLTPHDQQPEPQDRQRQAGRWEHGAADCPAERRRHAHHRRLENPDAVG
jgi:hypothetical protein